MVVDQKYNEIFIWPYGAEKSSITAQNFEVNTHSATLISTKCYPGTNGHKVQVPSIRQVCAPKYKCGNFRNYHSIVWRFKAIFGTRPAPA
jgi:hypothetical protein